MPESFPTAEREVPLEDRAGLTVVERATLVATVRAQRTLADVLDWARAQTPPRVVAEIVAQDEYTHDVVLPLGERLVLAYDTN